MKQPTRDRLREALRTAADTIVELKTRVLWWEKHHEQAVADALMNDGMPRWLVLVIGLLLGAGLVAMVEALT